MRISITEDHAHLNSSVTYCCFKNTHILYTHFRLDRPSSIIQSNKTEKRKKKGGWARTKRKGRRRKINKKVMWIRLLCNADPDSSWNQKEKIGLIKYLLYKVFMETLDFLFVFSDCSGIIWRKKILNLNWVFRAAWQSGNGSESSMLIQIHEVSHNADPDPRHWNKESNTKSIPVAKLWHWEAGAPVS